MRQRSPRWRSAFFQLVKAVVKKVSEPPLQKRKPWLGRLDVPLTPASLRDIEADILIRLRDLIENIGKTAWYEAQEAGDIVERLRVAQLLQCRRAVNFRGCRACGHSCAR